ncbi:acyl-CoA thioesterase [Halioxenophilus sp. WMMB6]|uniref:acyl-CoA thioesterase n=1 Tax=Halioxenophilus sp. WMMB6 TaxID=3073815 RepID=UPI00295F3936|nr:acyl-CoA thioesterase [Halioxenophilus sp. WMMB6]
MSNSQAEIAFIEHYPFTVEHATLWGDMDALNHVNNVQYYRYFEHLRTVFFYQLIGAIQTPDFSPVVAESSCRFLSSITYPDNLILGLGIEHIGSSQVIHQYAIFSKAQQRIAATGVARMVNTDSAQGGKKPLLEEYKTLFETFRLSSE